MSNYLTDRIEQAMFVYNKDNALHSLCTLVYVIPTYTYSKYIIVIGSVKTLHVRVQILTLF